MIIMKILNCYYDSITSKIIGHLSGIVGGAFATSVVKSKTEKLTLVASLVSVHNLKDKAWLVGLVVSIK